MINIIPEQYSHLSALLAFGLLFHVILWARNGRFLLSRWRTILGVVGIAEVWMLITDPIGGHWQAWYFTPEKVMGIWFFGVMPIEDFFGMLIVSSAAACAVLVFGYGPRKWI